VRIRVGLRRLLSSLLENRTRHGECCHCSRRFSRESPGELDRSQQIGKRKMPESSEQVKIFGCAIGHHGHVLGL
jgi:hypothetical protein